jgi:hypothetical protein
MIENRLGREYCRACGKIWGCRDMGYRKEERNGL